MLPNDSNRTASTMCSIASSGMNRNCCVSRSWLASTSPRYRSSNNSRKFLSCFRSFSPCQRISSRLHSVSATAVNSRGEREMAASSPNISPGVTREVACSDITPGTSWRNIRVRLPSPRYPTSTLTGVCASVRLRERRSPPAGLLPDFLNQLSHCAPFQLRCLRPPGTNSVRKIRTSPESTRYAEPPYWPSRKTNSPGFITCKHVSLRRISASGVWRPNHSASISENGGWAMSKSTMSSDISDDRG